MNENNPVIPSTSQTQPVVPPAVAPSSQNIQPTPKTPQPQIAPPTAPVNRPQVMPAVEVPAPTKSPFFSFWLWGPLIFILNAVTVFWFLVFPRMGNFIDVPPTQQILERKVRVNKLVTNDYAALVVERTNQVGIGNKLAETGMLWPGTYKSFDLRMVVDEALSDEEFLREVTPGLVYATLYKDVDEDRFYNPDIDTEPVRDLFGNPIRVEFVIQ